MDMIRNYQLAFLKEGNDFHFIYPKNQIKVEHEKNPRSLNRLKR